MVYIGRSLTLYNDPEVTWAGNAVGGIKISHATDINGPKQFPLALNGKKKVLHKVLPLATKPKAILTPEELEEWKTKIDESKTIADLGVLSKAIKAKDFDDSKAPLIAHYTEKMGALRNE